VGRWLWIAVVVGLAGCGSTTKATGRGTIKVVAAENFWGNVAAQIGGAHVSVTSIIGDPSTDPHEFESDAHDAAAVADASLVVENGLGYDDFMRQLLGTTRKAGRVVVTAADAAGVHGSGVNPHLWYSTTYTRAVAKAIATALERVDAVHAAEYAQNRETFDNSLARVEAVVDEIATRHANAPVAYTERVPGYVLRDAHVADRTPPGFAQANEEGNEPSASDTQAMETLLTTRAVELLLYNAQATSAASTRARQRANRAGIPVVAVTETMPADVRTYQDWQLTQDQAILTALGG
jgi:zinc/manganese transport system substrate-binding protein